jgi:hypothetical protein
MSFEKTSPHPFSYGVIMANAPRTSGIYGFFNATERIYVGAADNIYRKLMEHLFENDTPVKRRDPTGFVFEICSAEERSGLNAVFTSRYRPVCTDRPELLVPET